VCVRAAGAPSLLPPCWALRLQLPVRQDSPGWPGVSESERSRLKLGEISSTGWKLEMKLTVSAEAPTCGCAGITKHRAYGAKTSRIPLSFPRTSDGRNVENLHLAVLLPLLAFRAGPARSQSCLTRSSHIDGDNAARSAWRTRGPRGAKACTSLCIDGQGHIAGTA